MLDNMMNSTSGFMEKVSLWITFPVIPWADFRGYWMQLVDMVAPWNRIFPITDMLVISGLIVSFSTVMMVLFTIAFIKSFIPMSGGK